jgi:hypothetical protein
VYKAEIMAVRTTNAPAPPRQIRCRQIVAADIDAVSDLFARGFGKTPEHWRRCFQRLTDYPSVPVFPKYGYTLVCNGVPVGAILLIFMEVGCKEKSVRCHVCSWYVEPAYRGYASMLAAHALRRTDVTYVNAAPSLHTLPILKTHGYVRYSSGWFAALPALSPRRPGARVTIVGRDTADIAGLRAREAGMLRDHAGYGCLSLVCVTSEGAYPFVFRRRKFGVVPFAYLVYSRSIEDFVHLAGPIGRHLMRRGVPLVFVDATGPIPGLIGRYIGNYPKYYKGPNQPRLGDLAYSELVMLRFEGDAISRRRRYVDHNRHTEIE